MLAPRRAYAALAPVHGRSGPWIAVRRPLFVALLQGVTVAMTATHTVAAPVVVSAMICWTAAVLIQLATALLLVGSARRRTVPLSRAIDLFFLGHAPWSLWLLIVGGMAIWMPELAGTLTLATLLVPAALTARIVAAFTAVVLGTGRGAAILRAAAHQAITWVTIVALVAAAVALWPRILDVLA